jgi:hypothetical protein
VKLIPSDTSSIRAISGQVTLGMPPPPNVTIRLWDGPFLSGYRDGAGRMLEPREPGVAVVSGDPLTLIGSGFGTLKGRVWLNGATEATVTSWSESQITVRLPALSKEGSGKRLQIGLRTADGKQLSSLTWLLWNGQR